MSEALPEADVAEGKGLSDRIVTAMFWAGLGIILAIYFAQFRTPIWGGWNPHHFAYEVAHSAAAGLMMVIWLLHRGVRIRDWIIALLLIVGFVVCGYYFYSRALELSIQRAGIGSWPDMVLGLVMYVQINYLAWRYWGPLFPILGAIFVVYIFTASHLPGALRGPFFETPEIVSRVATHQFGQIVRLAARFLWVLVFMGTIMNVAGGGIALLGLAKLLSRSFGAGGPAFGSLVSSAIAGSFVGAGPSNVAVTGPITIPAMRSGGYTAEEAATVEALASNASAITPPILGTVAFIMADLIGVAYVDIIVLSLVPAALWFLSVATFLFAHARRNSDRLGSADIVSEPGSPWLYIRSALIILVPIAIILQQVIDGRTLQRGTIAAFLPLVALAVAFRVETRWSVWSKGLRQAAFIASAITVVLMIIAVIADSITWTVLGQRMGDLIEAASAGSVVLASIIMIIAGVVLGAGLPSLAVYTIMASTFAPVFTRLGVDFRVSHYTAFYIGSLSTIIPPVAGSVLVAAAIAGTKYWPVCRVIARVSWPLWIAPIMFILAPELLLISDEGAGAIALVVVATAVTLVGVQCATAGWLLRPLVMPLRVLLYANFALLLTALRQDSELLLAVSIGVVLTAVAVNMLLKGEAREPAVATGAET